ncbi:MAG: hypothetical protein ABI775_14225, partial [Pseudonocardiales bacterium]
MIGLSAGFALLALLARIVGLGVAVQLATEVPERLRPDRLGGAVLRPPHGQPGEGVVDLAEDVLLGRHPTRAPRVGRRL